MNIFYLDSDPVKAAQYQVNCHSIKMGVEGLQMLSTVMIKNGLDAPMKISHPSHPATIWCGESQEHFEWLLDHTKALSKEYTHRYGKKHKIEEYIPLIKIPKLRKGFKQPPQAMPDEYRNKDSIIAYRTYYVKDKLSQQGWRWEYKNRQKPEWVKDYL